MVIARIIMYPIRSLSPFVALKNAQRIVRCSPKLNERPLNPKLIFSYKIITFLNSNKHKMVNNISGQAWANQQRPKTKYFLIKYKNIEPHIKRIKALTYSHKAQFSLNKLRILKFKAQIELQENVFYVHFDKFENIMAMRKCHGAVLGHISRIYDKNA